MGVYNWRLGQVKFFPYEKWGREKRFQIYDFPILCPPPPIINDKSYSVNFEGLFLLSPSEIKRKLCKLIAGIAQGNQRYKVLMVAKNGKLNEIEMSALWSI